MRDNARDNDRMGPVTTGQPPDRREAGGLARLARVVAVTPVTARAGRELLFCVIGVPLGLCVLVILAALTTLPFLVTLLITAAHPAPRQAHPAGVIAFLGPAVLFVLVALLVLAPRTGRGLGAVHRRLAGGLLGEHISGPPPLDRDRRSVFRPVFWAAVLADGPGWRAVAYLLLKLPIAVLSCYAVVVWWGAGLAGLTYPLWWPWFRNHPPGVHLRAAPVLTPFGLLHVATFPGTFATFAAAAVMVVAAPWVTRAVVTADRWLMRGLLGPGRMAQRVADLERTRALAVDDSAALLRRLERDLHDGAQVRLATLAMNLGMALDQLGPEADHSDLTAVRDLVGTAHRGAKDALAELRDLVRGIHPPALDTGLADALATLAAGSPAPVELTVDLPRRPTPAIETIAYFCAAELLANAVKHSGASKITLTVAEEGQRLVVRVADDGHGGAGPAHGSGLAGLAQRAGTVDGGLDVTSPPGGPTTVTVTLPLHA